MTAIENCDGTITLHRVIDTEDMADITNCFGELKEFVYFGHSTIVIDCGIGSIDQDLLDRLVTVIHEKGYDIIGGDIDVWGEDLSYWIYDVHTDRFVHGDGHARELYLASFMELVTELKRRGIEVDISNYEQFETEDWRCDPEEL